MKRTITKYGLLALFSAAVLFLAALVLAKELSFSIQAVVGYASMFIALTFVFFGIKHFRDKENNGRITFRKAFIIGICISLFASVGFGIIDYIYTTAINPDFMTEYAAVMKEQGEEDVQMYSSTALAILMFATVLVMGFIITLLSSFILQRK
ncbi:MAG: DUF4199 domain-containing protein [Bacteroidota bacterium]